MAISYIMDYVSLFLKNRLITTSGIAARAIPTLIRCVHGYIIYRRALLVTQIE